MKKPRRKLWSWLESARGETGYKCQFPGCNCSDKLQVHHIQKYADFPHLRFDLKNVITLCKTHHNMVWNNEYLYAGIFQEIVNRKTKGL